MRYYYREHIRGYERVKAEGKTAWAEIHGGTGFENFSSRAFLEMATPPARGSDRTGRAFTSGSWEAQMIRREMLLFEKGGKENTQATLEAARERAAGLGIKYLILATSTGETALQAAEVFAGTDVSIVGVTLHAGLWEKYSRPDPEKVKQAQAKGVKFLTATHTLMGNVESAIREKFGGVPPVELIAHTYYTFSQGMKVAVEVAVMAADAGLISDQDDVIALGGTGQGADTAVVLRPAYSTDFFTAKVREIIAMPR